MKNVTFKVFLMIISITMLSSCAAYKSKKCQCPTFGKNKVHGQINVPASEKKNS